MTVEITKSKAIGKALAPPSKSMAHRALICGALSSGSIVRNVAESEDIRATLNCLENLGAVIEKDGDIVKIGGLRPQNLNSNAEIFCNESGSTLRFLVPLCMLCGCSITLKGSQRLMQRPLNVYEDIARENGITVDKSDDGITVCGRLRSGEFKVPGNISSQFITGLLFALPLLSGDSVIEVTGKFESASYIDLTLAALADFGITVRREGNRFFVPGNQSYMSCDYTVEGDCSNAAFLHAFNLLGGDVKILGLKDDTLQGDRVYRQMFEGLKSGEKLFDLSDCPDLGPVMFAVSAALGGGHRFVGTARLKIKESDRAAAMAEELKKFGVKLSVGENDVLVERCSLTSPAEIICSHNDHRIVMSLALLCSVTGGVISGASAVNKSFPDFFQVIKSLGIGIV